MVRMARKLGLAVAILLLAPLSAQALGISITNVQSTGSSTSVLAPGDVVTFDLVMENNALLDVWGLGVGARGFDVDRDGRVDDGLSFTTATTAAAAFNDEQIQGAPPGFGTGGLNNELTPGAEERGFVWDPIAQTALEQHVLLFNGISGGPASGNGGLDIGIGGDSVSNGDIHFQISFQATPTQLASRDIVLEFGTMEDLGHVAVGFAGVLYSFNDAQYTLTVIPEPGTALLMGFGLIGLASQRRR